MNRIIYYFKRLIGSQFLFSLETRIFHAVCLAMVFCVAINIPIVMYLRIATLPAFLSLVAATAGGMYYLSRVKRYHKLSVGLFQVFINTALIVNYYYNSGVNGPTFTIFLMAFLVCVITSPTSQFFIWLPLNVLLVIGLLTLEFTSPGLIKNTYSDDWARYIDLISSYLFVAAFAFMITAYVRKTYNRQREELIAKSEALEAANRTKNKLLSIIGHDLKEPMNSLQNYLEILVDFDLGEKERREIKSQLLSMTKNASMMLNNMLLWTRGQMENFSPDMQVLSVNEVLESVMSQVEAIARNKQIALQITIPSELSVQADRQMLEMIIRNILTNAIKFTTKGGNVWLSATQEGTNCVISIRDDGVGIPAELQPHIFTVAVKSQNGTEFEKGVGLGLMLCKEFAELQGGELTFVSKVGDGTTFSLVFPGE